MGKHDCSRFDVRCNSLNHSHVHEHTSKGISNFPSLAHLSCDLAPGPKRGFRGGFNEAVSGILPVELLCGTQSPDRRHSFFRWQLQSSRKATAVADCDVHHLKPQVRPPPQPTPQNLISLQIFISAESGPNSAQSDVKINNIYRKLRDVYKQTSIQSSKRF